MHSPLFKTPVAPVVALRERTQTAHTALEQTPLARDLMSVGLSLARYVEILATWVDAWSALEDCIEASAFAPGVEALLPPQRAHLGHGDLRYWAAHGHTLLPAPSPGVHAMRQLKPTDSASLLGMCYVVRGASLGAQVITRHLLQTLPQGAAQGITFFAPGTVPALSWPQWSQALSVHLEAPEALARAVVAADATFVALQRAFSCLPNSVLAPKATHA